jgi:hypothetical protein
VLLQRRVACRRAPVGCFLDQAWASWTSLDFVQPDTGTTDDDNHDDDTAVYASTAAVSAMDNSRGVLPSHVVVVVVIIIIIVDIVVHVFLYGRRQFHVGRQIQRARWW